MIQSSQIAQILPSPVNARHSEYSMIYSADDDPGRPTDRLVAIGLDAAEHARHLSLIDISRRMSRPPFYPDVWPGEHYRLLGGLVLTLSPQRIVEIGTGNGLSALSMKKCMPENCQLVTFDTRPWDDDPMTLLTGDDFADERLVQRHDDLADPLLFPLHVDVLKNADIIFVDAAKDGITEERILRNLSSLQFDTVPIVVFDDIKLWNMLKIWRMIAKPKLDMTSFGHWSGTGFIEWRPDRR